MPKWLLGPVDELVSDDGPQRHLFDIDGTEVGVFQIGDEFVAYRNWCPHQGGPACEGDVGPRVVNELESPMDRRRPTFSKTELTLRCPWHGWEYDITTGRSIADPRYGLLSYRVLREGDDLFLSDE